MRSSGRWLVGSGIAPSLADLLAQHVLVVLSCLRARRDRLLHNSIAWQNTNNAYQLLKSMPLTSIQLDQRRADMMMALYRNSGRTCGTYTGLWAEFSLDVARNLRDMDWSDLKAACVAAIGGTDSHLAEHHAEACIRTIRAELVKGWE